MKAKSLSIPVALAALAGMFALIKKKNKQKQEESASGVGYVDNEWGANEMYLVIMNTESLYNRYMLRIADLVNRRYKPNQVVSKIELMLQKDIRNGNIYLETGMGKGKEARKMAAKDLYNNLMPAYVERI